MSRLDEIRERWEKATPGPWRWSNTSGGAYLFGARTRVVMAFQRMGMNGAQPAFRGEDDILYPAGKENINGFSDAVAIAHAREDVPFLLAEVERLNFLYGANIEGIRCTCECVSPGDHISPPEYEQDPWCPRHPDVNAIRQEFARVESERDAIQETARRNLVTIEKILDAPMFKHVKPHIMEAIEKGAR